MGLQPIQSLASRPLQLLSFEERFFWMLTMEHQNRVDSLHAALGAHQGNFRQPQADDDARTQAENSEWSEIDDELRFEIIAEDQCFHLPIGHEFGEVDDDERDLSHWMEAPGVVL